MQSHSSNKNYRLIQENYWKEFYAQLELLKDRKRGLDINYEEIARGLGISRQRLYQFTRKPEQGLPIDRANILELWDYLTAPEMLDSKDITQEARRKRDELRLEQASILDDLLRSSGFLPTSQAVDKVLPQIERVKRRLASPWIPNSSVLSKITDNIIDTILDQGGLAKSKEEKLEEEGYSAEEAITWPRENISNYDSATAENFAREITRFENLGKVRFFDNEMFELYQSIFENNLLRNFNAAVRVTDCQFKTLTFSLIDEFEKLKNAADLTEKLSLIFTKCEKDLRSSTQVSNKLGHSTEEFLRFPPIIETSVTLNIRDEEEPGKNENLVFQYGSSATHVENMLTALSNGLGYFLSDTLEITGFFIRAIGKSSDSLARVSISLTDKSRLQNYQGLWVEGNVIVGVLQAFLFASLNWLSDKIGSKSIPVFFDFCKNVSLLHQKLDVSLNKVYNHSYSHSYLVDENVEKELSRIENSVIRLAKDLEKLSRRTRSDNSAIQEIINAYYENYRENLATKGLLAKLALTHSAIVRSNSEQAKNYLRELKSNLYMGDLHISGNENFAPIVILYNSELMFYKLICGDRDFLDEKEWRNPATGLMIQNALQNLRDYVIKKNSGIIDVDVYLSITQLFGITGLVEFYVCQKEDAEYLDETVDIFLSAAYYSAKIGHRQRTIRALCHASRTCCRLGRQEIAEQIIEVAKALMEQASMSQFALSKGEILLRFRKSKSELYQAFWHFLWSWYHSVEEENFENETMKKQFFRPNIDSLYNIYRVLESFEENEPFLVVIKFSQQDGKEFFEREKYQAEELMKKFIAEYCFNDNDPVSLIKDKIKEAAISAWNACCVEERTHPFSLRIKEGSFLEDCVVERL